MTRDEKTALADHLTEVALVRSEKTRSLVKSIADKVAKDMIITNFRWLVALFYGIESSSLYAEVTHVPLDAIGKSYDLLRPTFKDYDLSGHPGQICDTDDSGITIYHQPPKVVAQCDQKKVHYHVSGRKNKLW